MGAVSRRSGYIHSMLSVIITSEGVEHAAVATLACLVPAAAAGVVRDVTLVDCDGSESIARVADVAGCGYLAATGSRAAALAAGAAQARSPWLMFLPAGAVLDPGWSEEAAQFVQSVALSGVPRAGIFRPARSPFARNSWRERLAATMAMRRGSASQQGLLIARDHYERLGGYQPGSRAPERRLLDRLGRSSRMQLRSRMVVV